LALDLASTRRDAAGLGADNASNIIFLNRTEALIAAVKRSSKMTVELTYYQNGDQTLTFDTHALKWAPAA
jgi:hypothetical protein